MGPRAPPRPCVRPWRSRRRTIPGSSGEAEGWLATACEHVPDDLPLTKVLLHGAPAKAILGRVLGAGHDLVVLGRDGTVRRHLARDAPVPVIAAGAPTPAPALQAAAA